MERLVTTSQAATILNLSLQGIHYRIKNNQLRSIKKDNKTYVYIPKELQEGVYNKKSDNNISTLYDTLNIDKLIESKNEQIKHWKEGKQY